MKKVLIVEDDTILLNALREAFLEKGNEVLTAKNGQQGLQLSLDYKPDLIILDILMPVMDGLEMIAELRKHESGKDIPIIILTNFEPDTMILNKITENPPTYYLIKSNTGISEIENKGEAVLHPEAVKSE